MKEIKLNKKDFNLLEILCKNSRKSTLDISKEMGISRQAVHKKLDKICKKAILKFVTILNYPKMGYSNMHLYLKIQGIVREDLIKKIKKAESIENVTWVSTLMGDYDLSLSVFFKSIPNLHRDLNKIYSIFKDSIKQKELHLIDKQFISHLVFGDEKKTIRIIGGDEMKISEKDKKILNYIKSGSRFEWSKLISQLKLNYQTVKKHISCLESDKIILGYGAIVNYNALDYSWNLCVLNTSSGHSLERVLEKIKTEKRIPFISTTVENKIIFDFVSQDYEELKEFLNKLKIEFVKEIENYKILNIVDLNKLEEFYG